MGGDGGRVDERIGFSASPILWGQGQCWDMCRLRWCRWGVGRGLGPGSGAAFVCVSMDYLCRWQVQVSVYCAWSCKVRQK